tara:strand:+ start:336 stop:575 length:240 start_codon:yes stop_codon:yes gene_type:complete
LHTIGGYPIGINYVIRWLLIKNDTILFCCIDIYSRNINEHYAVMVNIFLGLMTAIAYWQRFVKSWDAASEKAKWNSPMR